MRRGPFACLLSTLAACGALAPTERFLPIGDLHTTTPRSKAERGYGDPATPPTGLRWVLALDGHEESAFDTLPDRRFEMRATLIEAEPAEPPRFEPVLDGTVLVDDSGAEFACHQAILPEKPDGEETAPAAKRAYTFVFELPTTYRFRAISYATVHWHLRTPDGVIPISSRFQR